MTMIWVFGIALIIILLIIVFIIYAIIDSTSSQIIVTVKDQFKKKDDDEDDRKKYLEKKQRQIEQFQKNIRASQNHQIIRYTETRVVDIKKPIGKWTKLVTMTQLQYISNVKKMMGEKFSNKLGFWQIKVKAQAMSQGREKGKGR